MLCLLLSGCSFQGLLRGQIDGLLARRVSQDMGLYLSQQRKLKLDIKELRAELSPRLQRFRIQIELLPLENPTAEQINELYGEARELYGHGAQRFNPLLVDLIASLDQKQQARFLKSLERENEKLAREHESGSLEISIKRLQRVMGPLNQEQMNWLSLNAHFFQGASQTRIQRRQQSLEAIISFYSEEKKADQLLSFFNQISLETTPPEQIKSNTVLMAEFLSLTTSEQQKSLMRNRDRLVQLFDLLII
jgi:hypothetical protein